MEANYNNKDAKDPKLSQKDPKQDAADKRPSRVVAAKEESHAASTVADSGFDGREREKQQQPPPAARRSMRGSFLPTKKEDLVRFSIITDETQTGLTEYGFQNPRFSTNMGRASIAEQSVPTSSTVDFYVRQSKTSQTEFRRSQLASELSRLPTTQQLVSGRFSRAIVSEVLDKGGKSGPRRSYRPRESSLRYPDVGKLDLPDSDSEIDELPDS